MNINLIKLTVFILLSVVSLQTHALGSVTRGDAFQFYGKILEQDIPSSYHYIDTKFTDIQDNSSLDMSLKVLVYKDLIPNKAVNLRPSTVITQRDFFLLSSKILDIDTSSLPGRKSPAGSVDMRLIKNLYEDTHKRTDSTIQINFQGGVEYDLGFGEKEKILKDVYKTLSKEHFERDTLEKDTLIQGAIKGLTNATEDQYTSYFPPVESDVFHESLEGEYEGIGAYVEMNSPGILTIVSPIVGSPAETSGLKGGDRVVAVDGETIQEENALREVISWIKGPSGSTVVLTIKREGVSKTFDVDVIRAKIILVDVEYEKLKRDTAYIQIKNFGDKVDTQFLDALEFIKADRNVKKIIIDVRNNPGGFLDKVTKMLSYYIDEGQGVAIVGYPENDLVYKSKGYDIIDLTKYEVIFLQNGGSASASEILVGTSKDYLPDALIIGETSFGKGSVQSIKTYYDGSTLKYTVAKWFTGKSRTGIDGSGIAPDIELPFDSELWEERERDNQLEKALAQ